MHKQEVLLNIWPPWWFDDVLHVCDSYLTGVHTSFEDAGTQHPVGDLIAHQSLAHSAVDDSNLCLLQDESSVA